MSCNLIKFIIGNHGFLDIFDDNSQTDCIFYVIEKRRKENKHTKSGHMIFDSVYS